MKIKNIISKWLDFYVNLYKSTNLKKIYESLKLEFNVVFTDLRYKVTHLAKTNFELGVYHFNHGYISDAIMRFKFVKRLDKSDVKVFYMLARCYLELGKRDLALTNINLYLNADDKTFKPEAIYVKKIIELTSEGINKIPLSFIKQKFNLAVFLYKNELLANPESAIQKTIMSSILQHLNTTSKLLGNSVLDIGCGSGMLGKLCKAQKIASLIDGLDASEEILEIAKSRSMDDVKIYNNCFSEDFRKFCSTHITEKYDIIFAEDFLSYFSNLDFFFSNIANHLKPNGILSITFKTSELSQFNCLTEQFSYSLKSIEDIASSHNFTVNTTDNIEFLTKEKGKHLILILGGGKNE